MKKQILLATILALSLSLGACTQQPATNEKEQTTQEQTSQKENETNASVKAFLGQVSDKIGNDITLSLGKFVLDNDDESSQTIMVGENGEQTPYDGDKDDLGEGNTIMIPMPEDENQGDGGNASGATQIEKLPIEFTGEVKEFTIPAGAKIINLAGKEVTFDSIKKGSLVQIIINESTNAVEKLMVWN